MDILFAIPGINKNNYNCLLLCTIDNIKFKNNNSKEALLVYYYEDVDSINVFSDYEDLYSFIKKYKNDIKSQKATTFATLDVLTQSLDQIYESLEDFLNAYYNNLPYTFSIQFKLSNQNIYNLITMDTILSPLNHNKINLYIHRFKNTPLIDTLISLYIKKIKLPRLNTEKYNNLIIQQQSNTKQSEDNSSNNTFMSNLKDQINDNIFQKQQKNELVTLQDIKQLLIEFRQEILNILHQGYSTQNLNKYKIQIIEFIKHSNINEQNFQLVYNTLKTLLNNNLNQTQQNSSNINNVFDNITDLNLNDIV